MAEAWATEIQAAAARWHARLEDDADLRTQAEFERWRDADVAHGAAFERIAARHDEAQALGEAPEILSLRQQTLARIATRRRKPDFTASIAGAVLALLLVGGPLAVWFQAGTTKSESVRAATADSGQIFRTGVGQQLALTLVDGSRVTLNTASRLRVAYGDTQRRLVLESGEAWFEVAPDKVKPFVVIADGHRVVAHGTQFDVRLRPDRVDVMLAQGKVTVAPEVRGPSSAVVAMRPNQLLTVSASGTMLRDVRGGDGWASWRDGIVSFEDQPLADAVAEMNRYSRVQLRLADARTGQIRVSGAFNTGATTAFVEALEMGFAIDARRQGDGDIVLRHRSPEN